MFTKLFTKSHDPYELGGRWYKLTCSCDEDTGYVSVLKSDIPVFDEDEDVRALGYVTDDNSVYINNGYVLDLAFMALSGVVPTSSLTFGNEIDPDLNIVISTVNITNANGALFELYLYIVKR